MEQAQAVDEWIIKVATLREQILCRNKQITYLLNLFGKRWQVPVSCIFVYGLSATGKTFTISSIMQFMKLPHTIVNCIECFTPRMLYEITLNQISNRSPTPGNGYSNFASCCNANDFVRNLGKAFEIRNLDTSSETFYIILDKVEYLRQMDGKVLSVFIRLQEFMKLNLCVIMISQIVWEKFSPVTGLSEPIQIYFPAYSKDNISTILSFDKPDEYSKEFYKNYLHVILNVFHNVCGNLLELRYLAQQNFSKYVEPIKKGLATESNSQKLWRNIQPQLKLAIKEVYMRVQNLEKLQLKVSQSTITLPNASNLASRNRVELPFYSKYLLIAAYMASYNPISSDKRFFLKKHDKVGKKANINRRKRHENHLLGPKPFKLDRMLAIFYSIVEDKVSPSAHIYSQISSLVTLNMMTHVSKENLDNPKYKCNVSLDFIRSIARTVDFDVLKYLYDSV